MTVRRKAAERRGRWGETLAAWMLRLKFYRILGQRVRTRAGEIDLIARAPSGMLCFIEVKARSGGGEAVLAVGGRQKSRILRAAELYLAAHPGSAAKGVRFDIVAVAPGALPRHFADAFRPGDRV